VALAYVESDAAENTEFTIRAAKTELAATRTDCPSTRKARRIKLA
jgi:hypothetical protein